MKRQCLVAFAWLLSSAALVPAAPPELKSLFPPGGQAGTTVEVTADGKLDPWPPQAWLDAPGLTVAPAKERGKFSVAIAADAAPGLRWLRLYNAEGASPLAPFVVGRRPEVLENEPNHEPAKAQRLPGPTAIVNGRLQRDGDVDIYAVAVEQGQTLVVQVAANGQLSSPVDPIVQIASQRGFVLAENDDATGLDPLVTYVAPQTDVYLIRVFGFPAAPNSSIALAGDSAFVYRLTVTTAGFVDYALPLAVSNSGEPSVALAGWNLAAGRQAKAILDPGKNLARVVEADLANVFALPAVAHPSLIENEPNGTDRPQHISMPATVTGQIGAPRDKDVFAFQAAQGKSVLWRLESRALGYPLDAVLEVQDAAGKSLAKADDVGELRDPELVFAAPAEGTYRIVVADLHRQGGPRYFYRLTATIAQPGFALTIDSDSLSFKAGDKLELPVNIDRQHGFAAPIVVRVAGLPAQVACEPVTSPVEGDAAKQVKLVLTATEPFSGPVQIVGEAPDYAPRVASAPIAGRAPRIDQIWLTVAPK